jgi:hypothetical protein
MKAYVLRISSQKSQSGYEYLQSAKIVNDEWEIRYTAGPWAAMTWPTAALAREYKQREDLPQGLGRVVFVTNKERI